MVGRDAPGKCTHVGRHRSRLLVSVAVFRDPRLDWAAFLDDFQRHWPTDEDHAYVDFVRQGALGDGAKRAGNARWRRLTEEHSGSAKSVFHFDVQGQVAKSTHAGIPWLRFIRQRLGARVLFWPFDGWEIPENRSVIAEVYPSLWRTRFPKENRTDDQHMPFASQLGSRLPIATAFSAAS